MYGGYQTEGNAAFEGGGFMPSNSQTNEQSYSSSSATKNRDSQTLLPLTVKQIISAPESMDNLQIDGVGVNSVTLVGRVVGGKPQVSVFNFLLDDGTGRIDCTRWINTALETNEVDQLRDGMYVRVIGNLKALNGNRQIMVYYIRPLTEFDELTYHFVDCIYVHDYNTRVRGSDPNSAVTPPSKAYQPAPSNQYTRGVQHDVGRLSKIQDTIRTYMQKYEGLDIEKGVDIRKMGTDLNIPLEKMKKEIEILVEEGIVYSTINDFFYKTTTN